MAGVGKTTLAQILYNDIRVRNHFHLRSWASISEASGVYELTKKIFESCAPKYSNIIDLNVLQVKLQDILARHRFLLVLDGFSSINSLEWDMLRRPFQSGKSWESRIIVTTHSQSVAMAIQAFLTHSLSPLSHEDTWKLFSGCSFKHGNPDEYPILTRIGKEIVRKCNGLPLAAKVLGSLVRSKEDVEEWESVSQSHIWELPSGRSSILPALILSYCHLPPLLKRCFAYCSVFPKGHEIKKWDLIYLWMAEGILPQPDTEKRMEDIGVECFQELHFRSFFHESTLDKSHFMMHDLISDLAQFVAGDFCYMLGDNNTRKIKNWARHLSFSQDKYEALDNLDSFTECQQLRTFLPFRSSKSGSKYAFTRMVQDLLEKQNPLRVLSLSYYEITKFPVSIGNSLHLRYLNLANTTIECLPPDVCSWYNLETLILSGCRRLSKLPDNMFKLINLRHLDISGSKVMEMPAEFGRLNSLQVLTDFIVSNGRGSKISELGSLLELRGALSIGNLQNVADAIEASNARLRSKKYLHELEFKWTTTAHNVDSETAVLNMLVPHQNVKRLKIQNFGGSMLPNWLGSSAFSRMVVLQLVDCKTCLSLPSLGQLPSLEKLSIAKMRGLQRIGPEFYGYVTEPFKTLKILKFEDMPNWEEWLSSKPGQAARFPSLEELHITRCPKFTGKLPDQLPSLVKLVITTCQSWNGRCIRFSSMVVLQLVDCESCLSLPSLGQLPSLEKLYVSKMRGLHKLGLEFYGSITESFKSLKIMKFEDMPNWEEWSTGRAEQESRFPSLEELEISRCPKLIGKLPRRLPSLRKLVITACQALTSSMPWVPKLTTLELTGCDALESLSERMMEENECLETIIIRNCSSLTTVFREGLLPSSLRSLEIYECRNLELFVSPSSTHESHQYPALKRLHLRFCCSSLISFPMSLFTNLEELQVQGCSNLKKISSPPNCLPYLRKLELKDCSKLVLFPEGGLPAPKLESLSIRSCTELSPDTAWGLHAMTSLTSLYISGIPSLTSLENTGIQFLASLRTLEIEACDKLAFLPLDRLVHSLSHLTIRGCSLLKDKCERDGGEYRSLVSLVPYRVIED
ncbi:putative disease resistance protein At3g14460 [Arachis stenosperma]|uniref:putative disease resistance protein At3g14460 n=1 Tax=Arachis stenosperma TaxID=217475 RepID=UPI0025AD5544|nr:putative disease resistance protein At3g14460 [Arachis stenosperma]